MRNFSNYKTQIISVISLALLECYTVNIWRTCKAFADSFRFSSFDLSLRLIEAIHNDHNVSIVAVRIFHNKIIGTILDIFKEYISYFDTTFLISLFSLVGVFGIVCGVWYLIAQKKKIYLIAWVAFLAPFFILLGFPLHFFILLLFMFLPFQIISLYGMWQFTVFHKKKTSYILLFTLFFISVWWLHVYSTQLYYYCVKM